MFNPPHETIELIPQDVLQLSNDYGQEGDKPGKLTNRNSEHLSNYFSSFQ